MENARANMIDVAKTTLWQSNESNLLKGVKKCKNAMLFLDQLGELLICWYK